MNIYRVIEDGVDSLVKAKTMSEAIEICLRSYLDELEEDDNTGSEEYEKQHYQDNIIESCSLIGELKN